MRRFFSICLLCLFPLIVVAHEEMDGKQEEADIGALQKWLKDKRLVTVKEIGGNLSLSGEVRVEMQGTHERKNVLILPKPNDQQRGHGGFKPSYGWDVEVNIMLDYHTDRTWAAVKLEFDNDMGTFSGTTNKIKLEKAFLGGRIIAGDTVTFDAEIGRRFLNQVYDSKVEFSSLYDGLLLRFSKASEAIGDFYINAGPFVVDDKFNHYAWIAELGFLRIGNTGFFVKYSIVDWKKHYSNKSDSTKTKNPRFDYLVNQLMLGYQCNLPSWNKFLKVYLAGLYNPYAKPLEVISYKRANLGWYVGVSLGQIRKAGDWAFDTNYQWVRAQTVPDFDAGGIKRGNAEDVGTYTVKQDGTGGAITNKRITVGGGNFKGLAIDFLYAFTASLTMQNSLAFSKTLDHAIGPSIHYLQYEIELIYAF
ncbi:MAG: hypothetical protein WCP39_01585 [Chlamydiota bacterium]